nr:(6-4)DNA photolyase [Ipomoea batatas]GMC77671.1 (6-4)DNA photolyase [Ipomoea batatas]
MAATFRCFRTIPIQCFSSSSSSSANRSKADPSSSKQTSGSNWWAPLFGPNFINGSVPAKTNEMKIQAAAEEIPFQRLNLEVDGGRSKFRAGCFTEEKAVELRKVTIQTSTFHDKMYHSAIASRLASDVSDSERDNTKRTKHQRELGIEPNRLRQDQAPCLAMRSATWWTTSAEVRHLGQGRPP